MFRIGVIGYGTRLNSVISTIDKVGGAELCILAEKSARENKFYDLSL